MFHPFTISFPPLLVLLLLFSAAASADENSPRECLTCHEETYVEATAYSKMHTVVKDDCTKCHYLEAAKDKSTKMASTTFRENIIFLLSDLTEDEKKYLIQVNARDTDENMASPVIINTGNEEPLNYQDELYELKEISDIKVEKVKKKLFAKAVISWKTEVPTAFTIKYSASKKKRVLASKNIYTREHRAILAGLRHNSKYYFNIIAIDMNGNTLRSEEQIINTTRAFDLTKKEAVAVNDPDLKPGIEDSVLMTIGDRKDVFIRIFSNEPVKFNLSMTEIEGEHTKPCDNFIQTRSSTITICTECHAHESSHPVDIRSKNQDIKTPTDLPTVENGLITCVTCHFAHGSETDYFLRTKEPRDLCVKCHRYTPEMSQVNQEVSEV